ncbi:MAG TPA: NHLP bacteriocin export ABC transporter permease/ATPase subunit, partial [Cyanobacteria bacterium UBA11369]|nr:NHLP bacteriocin export ABC transporter permease/ATPase subunit [Cyanobacteria bacterium UBA11369]
MVNLIQKTNQIKGNELLLLNDPQKVWLVQSGSLAVFTTLFEGSEPKGSRRYLFSVNAGEALFGATPKQQRGILAVALEETELFTLEFDELTVGDGEAIALIQTWIHHLGKSLIAHNLTTPDNPIQTDGEQYLYLQKGQALQTDPETVTWVKLQQGETSWMGIEQLKLNPTSPIFPLAPGMWLQAEEEVELQLVTQNQQYDQLPIT